MKIDIILSSIQSRDAERREQQRINAEYGGLTENNAYIYIAK